MAKRTTTKKGAAAVEEVFLQCDFVGPSIFTELDGSKQYYSEVAVNGIHVKFGDIARVTLEDNDYDDAFCQVLAIYDDVKGGEGVFIEAKWFKRPQELNERQRKTLQQTLQKNGDFLENELIETDILDDIPAGSILGKIELQAYEHMKKRKRDEKEVHGGDVGTSSSSFSSSSSSSSSSFSLGLQHKKACDTYYCRVLETSGSHSMQIVSIHSMFKRGMDISCYQYAYASVVEEYDSIRNSMPTDKFSVAIRKLHVSVLPDFLPCRTEQREKIQNSIREAIVQRDLTRALYISGMPGTGKTATVVASIRALMLESRRNEIPEFQFVEINCLRLHTPSDAYTVLWRHLSGKKNKHIFLVSILQSTLSEDDI